MTDHTPGPWSTDGFYIKDARGYTTAYALTGAKCIKSDCEANAKLIAAAPEMLQALKWALKHLDELAEQFPDNAAWSYGAIDPRALARAAIAKATQ